MTAPRDPLDAAHPCPNCGDPIANPNATLCSACSPLVGPSTPDGWTFPHALIERRVARAESRAYERGRRDATPALDVPVDDVTNELNSFHRWAAGWMRRRLDDGARKFGALSWRQEEYTDLDNTTRLFRAVEHLAGVLAKWRDPATAEFIDVTELGKRAADVANQAFMLADIQRRDVPRAAESPTPEPPELYPSALGRALDTAREVIEANAADTGKPLDGWE